jgi:hypothetical protein
VLYARVTCAGCASVLPLAVDIEFIAKHFAHATEACNLAAARAGWLLYRLSDSWSCPACVERSDPHGGAHVMALSDRDAQLRRVRAESLAIVSAFAASPAAARWR